MIDNIRAAIARYPYPYEYRAWPGPNSNTFTAYIAREVSELGLRLPATTVGKDSMLAIRPCWLLFAIEEGFELNVLGLNIGVDAVVPALQLPGIGRLGLER
jgi:hypothetical protein